MTRRRRATKWCHGLDLGQPALPERPVESKAGHLERCPFCGGLFDMRDLGQVFEHYDHQLAAGAPPAIDETPLADRPLIRPAAGTSPRHRRRN
jgi:hypothetical protein